MVLCIICIVAVSNYHGYRVGITVGQETDIVVFGEVLKRNSECINIQDLECLEITNQALVTVFNSKLSVLKEKGIFIENVKIIDEYLNWSKVTLSNKQ
jgi:hypothetical protein